MSSCADFALHSICYFTLNEWTKENKMKIWQEAKLLGDWVARPRSSAAESGLCIFTANEHSDFFSSVFTTTLLFIFQINFLWVYGTNQSKSIRNPLKVLWKQDVGAVRSL